MKRVNCQNLQFEPANPMISDAYLTKTDGYLLMEPDYEQLEHEEIKVQISLGCTSGRVAAAADRTAWLAW